MSKKDPAHFYGEAWIWKEEHGMKTEVIVILDQSGSMGIVRQETIGSYNTLLEEQKKNKDECYMTLVAFNDSIKTVYEGKNLQDAPLLTENDYIPQNFTALLDAVGDTINKQGKRFEISKPEKVICVIITDGQENASKRFTRTQVFDLIKRQQDEWKWVFTYLGANVDAFAEAHNLGIPASAALNFNPTQRGIVGMGQVVSAFVDSNRANMAYAYSADDSEKAKGNL